MVFKLLQDEDIRAIKDMLWNGHTQSFIANKYHISQAHIANISSGRFAGRILWEDGSEGGLPHWRKLQIHARRRKHGTNIVKAGGLLPRSEYERIGREVEAKLHPTPVAGPPSEPYVSRDIGEDEREAPRSEPAGPAGWENHPLAVQAQAEGDTILLEACKQTLAAASPDIWEEDLVYNLIQNVATEKRNALGGMGQA